MAFINNNDIFSFRIFKKNKDVPSQIRICKDGTVYIDEELYDETNSKYDNLTIDIEKHNRISSGEETQRIIDSSKSANKGDTVIIKDEKHPDRTETTKVRF